MSSKRSARDRLWDECLAGRVDGFFMFYDNGRPVIDDDFRECSSWMDWHSKTVKGVGIAGWFALNDGGDHGGVAIPYWSDLGKAISARREITLQYELAGMEPPNISVISMKRPA
jgi:hypothetical protein